MTVRLLFGLTAELRIRNNLSQQLNLFCLLQSWHSSTKGASEDASTN